MHPVDNKRGTAGNVYGNIPDEKKESCKTTTERIVSCTHFDEKKEAMEFFLRRKVSDEEVVQMLSVRNNYLDFPTHLVWRQVSFVPKDDFVEEECGVLSSQMIDETAGPHFDLLDDITTENKGIPKDYFKVIVGTDFLVFREIAFDEASEFYRAMKDPDILKLVEHGCLKLIPSRGVLQVTAKLTKTLLSKLDIIPAKIYKFHDAIITVNGINVTKENIKKFLKRNI